MESHNRHFTEPELMPAQNKFRHGNIFNSTQLNRLSFLMLWKRCGGILAAVNPVAKTVGSLKSDP
jgi:hypothetical protein